MLYLEMMADGTVPLSFAIGRKRPFTFGSDSTRVRADDLEDYATGTAHEYHAWAIAKDAMPGRSVYVMVAWEETSGFDAEVFSTWQDAYLAGLQACGSINSEDRFEPQTEHFYTEPATPQPGDGVLSWWLVGDRMTEDDDGAVYGHVVELTVG